MNAWKRLDRQRVLQFENREDLNSLCIRVTDFVSLYEATFERSSLQESNKVYNKSMEISVDRIVKELTAIFSSTATSSSIECLPEEETSANGGVKLVLKSKIGPSTFHWRMHLRKTSPEAFSSVVLRPLLSLVLGLRAQRDSLCQLLQRKDKEIDEYRASGATVISKNLTTAQFQRESFLVDALNDIAKDSDPKDDPGIEVFSCTDNQKIWQELSPSRSASSSSPLGLDLQKQESQSASKCSVITSTADAAAAITSTAVAVITSTADVKLAQEAKAILTSSEETIAMDDAEESKLLLEMSSGEDPHEEPSPVDLSSYGLQKDFSVFFLPERTKKKSVAFDRLDGFLEEIPDSELSTKASEAIIGVISSATTSIDLCLHIFSHRLLVKAVVSCINRGIRVRFVADEKIEEAFNNTVLLFRELGVPTKICQVPGGMMHHKFAIVDRKIVITGSFNWTNQGFVEEFEDIYSHSHIDAVTVEEAEMRKS
ncbi:unnamed protein product [Cyprideis torosa]|uniref:Mitochondrial cardiolipin hydrolase n=1 Tax=Cyprideis torosa TaxID=163714 RepID=A0A7R8WC92_9CRUS|nr:unnamed protein product [Cyprideis torosa]CAG0893155.1 unnamed protein product [Cyprideis torosa]